MLPAIQRWTEIQGNQDSSCNIISLNFKRTVRIRVLLLIDDFENSLTVFYNKHKM